LPSGGRFMIFKQIFLFCLAIISVSLSGCTGPHFTPGQALVVGGFPMLVLFIISTVMYPIGLLIRILISMLSSSELWNSILLGILLIIPLAINMLILIHVAGSASGMMEESFVPSIFLNAFAVALAAPTWRRFFYTQFIGCVAILLMDIFKFGIIIMLLFLIWVPASFIMNLLREIEQSNLE